MAWWRISIWSIVVVVATAIAAVVATAVAAAVVATVLVIVAPLGVVAPLTPTHMTAVVAGLSLVVVAVVTLAWSSVVGAHLLTEKQQMQ